MDKDEYRRKSANLKRYMRDFPWLWGIIKKWHPDLVDIGVYYMDHQNWIDLRDQTQRIWFKIKDRSNFPYEEIIEVTPETGVYSLPELKRRFHQMSDVMAIEYIIVTYDVPRTQRKIILVFRPPKPQKVF